MVLRYDRYSKSNLSSKRANCSLPCYIKKKGNAGMRTKILMSLRSLMTTRKITLVLWVRTLKKTVANDRAEIKRLKLKFRGPVGLGGMNKWWKNELLKEHWPKSWMCSSNVVMVCYCCWNHQEESVKKGVGLSCSKNMWGREDERMLHCLLYCPGKSSGQNGMNHCHWTKYINSKPQRQNDNCTK